MKTIDQVRRERLALLIKEHGSQARLAAAVDKSPSQLSQWLNQSKNSITGKPRKMSDEAAREIEMRSGKPTGWMDQDESTAAKFAANTTLAPIDTMRIPVVSYIQAGHWAEIVDNFQIGDADEWLVTDVKHSRESFGLVINGNSMEPDFREGDRVIIDPNISPRPGSFVAASNGHTENGERAATFKKYRPRTIDSMGVTIFELTPLNPDYPVLRSDEHEIEIIGTMVEHRRYYK